MHVSLSFYRAWIYNITVWGPGGLVARGHTVSYWTPAQSLFLSTWCTLSFKGRPSLGAGACPKIHSFTQQLWILCPKQPTRASWLDYWKRESERENTQAITTAAIFWSQTRGAGNSSVFKNIRTQTHTQLESWGLKKLLKFFIYPLDVFRLESATTAMLSVWTHSSILTTSSPLISLIFYECELYESFVHVREM